ncbi:MAG: phosphate/phosphite/phosphonate ABC transporter substrate-binding protein [Archangium sp.]
MRRLLLSVMALCSVSVFAQQPATIVGVVASTNEEIAKKQSEALASFASSALKEQVLPRVYKDQEALAVALGKGEIDFAVMGPLAYLRIPKGTKSQLVFRTIRGGKATYRSVLFAPPSSKLTSLDALKKSKGTLKVAWVETSSASGYIVPKALLLSSGINPQQSFDTQDFLGSHDAVCQAVWEGRYDVGATFSDPVTNDTKVTGCVSALGKKTDSLKVIALSQEFPNDVLVAGPGVPAGKVSALAAAAKAAKPDVLKPAFLAEGVADVKDEDFTPIRKALDSFVP